MSCNIKHVRYLSGKLSIRRSDAKAFRADDARQLAEVNFFDELSPNGSPDVVLPIGCPWWCGECSASTYDNFLDALELTTGDADLLLVWGDSELTGLRVRGGDVTETGVKVTLEG